MGISSCDNGLDPKPEAQGQLKLSTLGVEVDGTENEISRAGVNTDTFTVLITASDGRVEGKYDYWDMPEIITLPVGDYTVSVESHKLQKAEWNKPYYAGSKDFKIADGEITEIGTVVCTFQSLKVSVAFSDELLGAMSADSKVTVVANDEGLLEYLPEEKRVGCFAVLEGSNTLVATFNGTVNGQPTQVMKSFNTVQAGQHYKLSFRIKGVNGELPDEFGQISTGSGISISLDVVDENVDGSFDDEEDIIANPERPGVDDPEKPGKPDEPTPDDPIIPDDPATSTITITSDNISFDSANPCTPGTYSVQIHSDLGLTNLKVKIESDNQDFINDVGGMMPLEFDLAYPGAYEAAYVGFDFVTGDQVIGQHDVNFDISIFVPLLDNFKPGNHRFILTAVDAKTTESKTLLFVAQ